MWRCGNDGPEIDADQEIQSAVDGVKDQIETKLGKTVSHIVAKRGCKQISNQKTYYVKCNMDDSWLHLKIHKDFQEKLTLQGVQEGKTEVEPVHYF